MVLLVPDIVLKLARLKVALDFIEAGLSQIKCLFDTNDMKIDAISREFLISCLREDLLIDPKLSRVRAFRVLPRLTHSDFLIRILLHLFEECMEIRGSELFWMSRGWCWSGIVLLLLDRWLNADFVRPVCGVFLTTVQKTSHMFMFSLNK